MNSIAEEGVEGSTVQRPYSLADFELIRVIGRGSYAKVLMVELRRTRRVYAMKVIKKELVTDDEVRTDLSYKYSYSKAIVRSSCKNLIQLVYSVEYFKI